MYTQQYRQPPAGYNGTAIQKPCACADKPAGENDIPLPPEIKKRCRQFGFDELLAAAIILTVISGGSEKNPALILALLFILL